MDRTTVESSNIKSAGYDVNTQTMEVEFVAGPVYQYKGVPQDVFNGLFTARSAGTYFALNVKNKYPYERNKS